MRESSLKNVLKKFPGLRGLKRAIWTRKRIVAWNRFLRFIPDETFLKRQYKKRLGRTPDVKNPKRFTEKLLWYKLNWRNPIMSQCADKYAVREYLKERGYGDLLNELYGVYDAPEEIDFDALPNEFILRTNNGDATNLVCLDKSKLDVKKARQTLQEFLDCFQGPNDTTFSVTRSWAYQNIKPKIIAERLLTDPTTNDASLTDYKFQCFQGKIAYFCVIQDRYIGEKMTRFDENCQLMNIYQGENPPNTDCVLPDNIREMCEIAKKLSADFPYVRVDLYNVQGKIYFGELTFYDAGGYATFTPDDFDFYLGDQFVLPPKYHA